MNLLLTILCIGLVVGLLLAIVIGGLLAARLVDEVSRYTEGD